ncbi:MAG: hypothetical protein QT02_C0003G0013 [archaeon GW2011_AR9]|nr:MAG: hypothetical protein QT02_C0003G0013 [archaeon GW2011_AR9]MBS3120936.1 hypothetical protein [Candidatus Woesearchaeota archaeon]HIG92685.1 hypothetical protein [Candidatus Woesearchaeota archaeon]HIH12370.1 hypothetical protein [Candidatus Woesearchaeota archaeon]
MTPETFSIPERQEPFNFLPGRREGDTLYLGSIPSWALTYAGVDGRFYGTAKECAQANELYWDLKETQ